MSLECPLPSGQTVYSDFWLTLLLSGVSDFCLHFFVYFQCCGAAIIFTCAQKDMTVLSNLKQENQTTLTKMTAVTVLILGTLYRSDLWHSSSWTFARSFVEVLVTLTFIPKYYTLWGILWKSTVVLPEVVVVFSMPLNFALLLYGSSYTSWALAGTGLFTSFWMMATHLNMKPNSGLS